MSLPNDYQSYTRTSKKDFDDYSEFLRYNQDPGAY
jgi:hypothetical protein